MQQILHSPSPFPYTDLDYRRHNISHWHPKSIGKISRSYLIVWWVTAATNGQPSAQAMHILRDIYIFHYLALRDTEPKPLLLVWIITEYCILVFPPLYLSYILPHSSLTGYHAYTQVTQLQTQLVLKGSPRRTWFVKRINIHSVHSHIHFHISFWWLSWNGYTHILGDTGNRIIKQDSKGFCYILACYVPYLTAICNFLQVWTG
jgi:hypothetical protein